MGIIIMVGCLFIFGIFVTFSLRKKQHKNTYKEADHQELPNTTTTNVNETDVFDPFAKKKIDRTMMNIKSKLKVNMQN